MNTFREIAHLHPRFGVFSHSGMPLSNDALHLLREMKNADTDRANALAGEVVLELRHLLSHDMAPLDEESSRVY